MLIRWGKLKFFKEIMLWASMRLQCSIHQLSLKSAHINNVINYHYLANIIVSYTLSIDNYDNY